MNDKVSVNCRICTHTWEIEELADILEVVYALCEMQGHSAEALVRAYEKKHRERGGFSKRIFLIGKE